jgi:hypothetical protein
MEATQMEDDNIAGTVQPAKIGLAELHPDIKDTLLLRRESLITELKELDTSILRVQEEYSAKLEQPQTKKKQVGEALHHIEALLRFEGYYANDSQYVDNEVNKGGVAAGTSVTDAAFGLLEEVHRPIHYKEIAAKLLDRNVFIPGKNPEATLLSRINRDSRFKRAKKRGVYALSTWRIRRVKPKRAKRRKSKKQQV